MKRLMPTVLLVLLSIALPACEQTMKQPDIKLNPRPKMRYEITLTIEDAPGTFDTINGSAGYLVSNDRCVPVAPISGAQHIPRMDLPLVLNRVSEKIYKGTFYVDYMQDEDYFGRGLCCWSMPFADFSLSIGNLKFSHSIALADILAESSISRHFKKWLYFIEYTKAKRDDHPLIDTGNANRTDFKEDARSTFSMTLSAREKFE